MDTIAVLFAYADSESSAVSTGRKGLSSKRRTKSQRRPSAKKSGRRTCCAGCRLDVGKERLGHCLNGLVLSALKDRATICKQHSQVNLQQVTIGCMTNLCPLLLPQALHPGLQGKSEVTLVPTKTSQTVPVRPCANHQRQRPKAEANNQHLYCVALSWARAQLTLSSSFTAGSAIRSV